MQRGSGEAHEILIGVAAALIEVYSVARVGELYYVRKQRFATGNWGLAGYSTVR